MESSETRSKAIDLGKALVQELRREPDVDTLSRWMAHYVAEQIVTAENASGASKAAAEERCFRTILSLWEHRATLPRGHRPFEAFDPILRALAALDPEERHPYYHRMAPTDQQQDNNEPDSVQVLVDFILGIDFAARLLIQTALNEATEKATSERTKALLENAIPASAAGDIVVLNTLLERARKCRRNAEENNAEARKRIQETLDKLDAFRAVCLQCRDIFAEKFKLAEH